MITSLTDTYLPITISSFSIIILMWISFYKIWNLNNFIINESNEKEKDAFESQKYVYWEYLIQSFIYSLLLRGHNGCQYD